MSINHTEWICPEGFVQARTHLTEALETRKLSTEERNHVNFLLNYLKSIDLTFGMTMVGPLGMKARPLLCHYTRVRGGRLYCRTFTGPKWNIDEFSYVCAQGMPNVLRPFLMRKWGHDIDIQNCHVSLMYQLGESYHTWSEHVDPVRPLELSTMRMLYLDRDAFIETIANTHMLPTDAEKYDGYRKHVCKPLLMRILYGGTYDAWLKENNLFYGRRSPHIVRLEREIVDLRRVVLNSKRFAWITSQEQTSQQHRGRSQEAANRGAFAKVAQHLECMVLLSMREFLQKNGCIFVSPPPFAPTSTTIPGLFLASCNPANIDSVSQQTYETIVANRICFILCVT